MPGYRKRFVVTYEELAGLARVATATVRNAASKGEFVSDSLDSMLQWVNARRARKGLPLVGIPDNSEVNKRTTPDRQTLENTEPEASCIVQPTVHQLNSGYDPLKGEYV